MQERGTLLVLLGLEGATVWGVDTSASDDIFSAG